MNRSINLKQIITRSPLCLLGLLGLSLFASPVAAQVFDSGPSDSALFDNVINVPPDPDPRVIGDNPFVPSSNTGLITQLNVFNDGVVGFRFAVFSNGEVNISGGRIAEQFETFDGSEVNISGGTVGQFFDVKGGVVNISGGTVGRGFEVFGGVVNISGGFIGQAFDAGLGVVNITGGSIAQNFEAFSRSEVNISGGNFGRAFKAYSGSDVELFGGEFELNGIAYSGSTISLFAGDVFTGTLADGSTFNFSNDGNINRFSNDQLSNVSLIRVALPTLDLSPMVEATANPNRPSGLRAGQTLTLLDGGQLGDNFEMNRATLNVEGGNIGDSAGAANSAVNISGGSVGTDFIAEIGSVVNISGGSVAQSFNALSGSEVNISGGTVGENFFARFGSEVNISGGEIGEDFIGGGQINISGGTLGDGFGFFSVVNISGGTFEGGFANGFGVLSEINLFGSNFVLNGMPLDDSLTVGNALTIDDRTGMLSGVLADGSAFSADLNLAFRIGGGPGRSGTLTVTLGPPVTEIILGDCNQDGEVTFLDIAPFIAVLASVTFLEQADCNQDGVVDFLDIAPFIAILAGGEAI